MRKPTFSRTQSITDQIYQCILICSPLQKRKTLSLSRFSSSNSCWTFVSYQVSCRWKADWYHLSLRIRLVQINQILDFFLSLRPFSVSPEGLQRNQLRSRKTGKDTFSLRGLSVLAFSLWKKKKLQSSGCVTLKYKTTDSLWQLI